MFELGLRLLYRLFLMLVPQRNPSTPTAQGASVKAPQYCNGVIDRFGGTINFLPHVNSFGKAGDKEVGKSFV